MQTKQKQLFSLFLIVFLAMAFQVVIVPIHPVHATTGWFGYASIGANTDNLAWRSKWGCQYTPSESGTLTDVTAYFSQDESGGPTIYLAVYADNGTDGPSTLLASVSRTDIPVSVSAWYTFTGFSLAITSGTKYWLSINNGNTFVPTRYATATCHAKRTADGGDAPPPSDPYGSGTDYTNREYSIYANYTVSGLNITFPLIQNLYPSGTNYKNIELAFQNTGIFNLGSTSYINNAFGFLCTGTISFWSYISKGMSLSFLQSSSIRYWDSGLASFEVEGLGESWFFTLFGNIGVNTSKTTQYEAFNSGDDSFVCINDSQMFAQTFTAQSSHDMNYVNLKLFLNGEPASWVLTVLIEGVDANDFPNGTILGIGDIHASSLTSNSNGEWITAKIEDYMITGPLHLVASTKYSIVLKYLYGDGYVGWRVSSEGSASLPMSYSMDEGETWSKYE